MNFGNLRRKAVTEQVGNLVPPICRAPHRQHGNHAEYGKPRPLAALSDRGRRLVGADTRGNRPPPGRTPLQKPPPFLDGLRPIVASQLQRPIDRIREGLAEFAGFCLSGRDKTVVHDTRSRVVRHRAGYAAIQYCAHRIDIRPGPLLDVFAGAVLLDRRISRRHDRRHGLASHGDRGPGGAEVDQRGHTVGAEHDVSGLNVSVQEFRGVDLLQCVQDRCHDRAQLGFAQNLLGFVKCIQGLPFEMFHHDVGCAVGFEKPSDPDDARMIEARQHSSLVQEPVKPPPIVLLVLARLG